MKCCKSSYKVNALTDINYHYVLLHFFCLVISFFLDSRNMSVYMHHSCSTEVRESFLRDPFLGYVELSQFLARNFFIPRSCTGK